MMQVAWRREQEKPKRYIQMRCYQEMKEREEKKEQEEKEEKRRLEEKEARESADRLCREESECRIREIANASQEWLKQEYERQQQEKIEADRKADEQATALALEYTEKLEAEKIEQKKELDFYRAEVETLRRQLEQMKQDRDAAAQKNAEQLEKLSKNCQNHDDDETIRNKSSINFETTTPEVVLQKQQLSVQNEPMNKVKHGDTEQQMTDKEADEKDEDVEVCVRQVMQMPEIDRRYWVKLLLPLMTQRARTVINRVTLADRDNYAIVKEQLLKEFKLTPREYRSKFMDAKKTAKETYTMFTARLKNLSNYYVKSRQVNDNYESLFDLFISEKLKESLPPGPLQFVLSKEGTECFKASMIADLADIHANNKIGMPSYSKQSYSSDKKNSSGSGFRFPDKRYQGLSGYNWQSQSEGNSPERKSYEKQDQKQVGWRTSKNTSMTELSKPRGFGSGYSKTNDDVKRCHHCGSDQHL